MPNGRRAKLTKEAAKRVRALDRLRQQNSRGDRRPQDKDKYNRDIKQADPKSDWSGSAIHGMAPPSSLGRKKIDGKAIKGLTRGSGKGRTQSAIDAQAAKVRRENIAAARRLGVKDYTDFNLGGDKEKAARRRLAAAARKR